jgi:hypothetical protein
MPRFLVLIGSPGHWPDLLPVGVVECVEGPSKYARTCSTLPDSVLIQPHTSASMLGVISCFVPARPVPMT